MKLFPYFLLIGTGLAVVKPTVFFIRHGEKPRNHDIPTLSPRGEKRAQCIRSVFGDASDFDIGFIMAETPKKSQSPVLRALVTIRANGLSVSSATDD